MKIEKEIHQGYFEGERSLFQSSGLRIRDTTFGEGESPLKESRDIELRGSMFKWKYPLWYGENIELADCALFEMARAGIWYTSHISVADTVIEAPKNFRRCKDVSLTRVDFPNAAETLWHCDGVRLSDVTAKGDYFGMDSQNIAAENFSLVGNYAFDGCRNVEVRGARMLSKDAFWNCENVTVYDSFISGEYLGWNGKNLTFVNCTIESLQGMCYIENLTLRGCKLLNTTLAFEYSTVDVDALGRIDSVKNPLGGRIAADAIGELILEEDKVDVSRTEITLREAREREE